MDNNDKKAQNSTYRQIRHILHQPLTIRPFTPHNYTNVQILQCAGYNFGCRGCTAVDKDGNLGGWVNDWINAAYVSHSGEAPASGRDYFGSFGNEEGGYVYRGG